MGPSTTTPLLTRLAELDLVTHFIGDGLRPVCRPIGDTIW